MALASTELFLAYREFIAALPHSGLPDCYRLNPPPYEHFLMTWQASEHTPEDPAAPNTRTPASP